VSRVNLLPPEIRERHKVRQRTILAGIIGAAVLLLILAFYFLQTFTLARVNDDLEAQEQRNGQLQAQIGQLQQFGDLQQELKEKKELEAAVFRNEVAWSGVLMDVSRVIPSEMVLDSLTSQLSVGQEGDEAVAAPTTPEASPPGDLVGQLSFGGQAVGIDTVTGWLSRLGQVQGWANPYTTGITQTGPRTRRYTFTTTVDLTKDIFTERGLGEETTP
jgi:Tfp pilus assembly protein PilN